jgi:hypothetical protein
MEAIRTLQFAIGRSLPLVPLPHQVLLLLFQGHTAATGAPSPPGGSAPLTTTGGLQWTWWGRGTRLGDGSWQGREERVLRPVGDGVRNRARGGGDALMIWARKGGPTYQHRVFAGQWLCSGSFDQLLCGSLDLNPTVQKDAMD